VKIGKINNILARIWRNGKSNMGYLKKTYSLLGLEEMWKCSQELFMELQSGIYLIGWYIHIWVFGYPLRIYHKYHWKIT
jgi:hypothetical protein